MMRTGFEERKQRRGLPCCLWVSDRVCRVVNHNQLPRGCAVRMVRVEADEKVYEGRTHEDGSYQKARQSSLSTYQRFNNPRVPHLCQVCIHRVRPPQEDRSPARYVHAERPAPPVVPRAPAARTRARQARDERGSTKNVHVTFLARGTTKSFLSPVGGGARRSTPMEEERHPST